MIGRRGFLRLAAGAAASVAGRGIPLGRPGDPRSWSPRATAEKFGWIPVKVNGKRVYVPVWK